jgi:hypothetical protein
MQKPLLLLFGMLVPALAFAKLGDTPDEAESRWGNPIVVDGSAYGYHTDNYYIVQIYGTDNHCTVSMYYRLDGNYIGRTNDDRLDASNITQSGVSWHEVNSGASGIRQWNSQDNTVAIIDGCVPEGNQNLYMRGYLTEEGAAYMEEHGWLDTSKVSDAEKAATR